MPLFFEKPKKGSGLNSHLGREFFLIVLLGFLLGLFLCGEVAAHAQSGKVSSGTEPERVPEETAGGVGALEVPREDGGKDKVYFSITTPQEEEKARQEEKEKEERSWDILNNIIIDNHNKRRR